MSEQFHPLEQQFQRLEGLVISPQTDLPFGKQFRVGFAEYTIYESATEKGYQAGIQAHLVFIKEHNYSTPVMLDDAGFSIVLAHFMPDGMNEHDTSCWRAHFIAGWTSVYMALVPEVWDWFSTSHPKE